MAFSERKVQNEKNRPRRVRCTSFRFNRMYSLCFLFDAGSHIFLSPFKYHSEILFHPAVLLLRFHLRQNKGPVISALGLTAAADAFLLVLDTNYTAGVLCFCGVQMLYYCRLLRAGGFAFLPFLPIRFLLTGCMFVFLGILHIWNLLTAAGVFYFTQLLFNAAESLALRHISLPYRLFSAGLILFLCCDLCVGLSNLPSAAPFSVPEPVLSFAQNGMWLFYLPSQVLITLSILPDYSSCTSESS